MKIIKNKEEYENFYYYKDSKPKKYPKEYPCVVDMVNVDCGIMGDGMFHYALYFPKTTDIKEAFLLGLKAKWVALD
jgi:hypothetical protein